MIKMKFIIISVLATIGTNNVCAQMAMANYQIHFQTDKTLYVSGENIQLKCVLSPKQKQTKQIMFADICDETCLLAAAIFISKNEQWNGVISIPDSTETGIYLLRAYIGTKKGEPIIASQPISILNRFGKNEKNERKKNNKAYHALNQLNYNSNAGEWLKTYSQTSNCLPGDTMQFSIENQAKECTGGISFSVYKVNNWDKTGNKEQQDYPSYTPCNDIKIYEDYTVRGLLSHKQTNKTVNNEIVFLSFPDSIAQIQYDYTDSDGIFCFHFDNYFTKKTAIIQSQNKISPWQITLYPSQLQPPGEIPFYLPNEVENSEFAQLAIQRANIQKAYYCEYIDEETAAKKQFPFYGYAQNRIYPNQYIDLPNFKEIAWEILPQVKYRFYGDSVSLKLWNPQFSQFFNCPMLLIDGVPFLSLESLNRIKSKDIKWIDIQAQNRCYGNLPIDGLMNIQTINGDYTIFELPENAIRINLDPNCPTKSKILKQSPFRDVLYWEPYISPSHDRFIIQVPCSDETGKYVAIAQLYDHTGKLHRSVFQFEVKNNAKY